jgi:hypothetical protein
MNAPYTPTEEDITNAFPISFRRHGYPPVRERIEIVTEPHPDFKTVVFLSAIPDRFHSTINALGRGSTCPVIQGRKNAMYEHDVWRWLRSVGVEAEFVAP